MEEFHSPKEASENIHLCFPVKAAVPITLMKQPNENETNKNFQPFASTEQTIILKINKNKSNTNIYNEDLDSLPFTKHVNLLKHICGHHPHLLFIPNIF